MTFRTALLGTVERLRGRIPGRLDLRPRKVTVRVRTWTGARPGVGTYTDVDTVLLNAGVNVKVAQVSTKDIVASGGRYASGDLKIGPITPEYPGGGTPSGVLDPPTTTTAREIFYLLEGPGFPDEGAWCVRVQDDVLPNFHGYVVVRLTGLRI